MECVNDESNAESRDQRNRHRSPGDKPHSGPVKQPGSKAGQKQYDVDRQGEKGRQQQDEPHVPRTDIAAERACPIAVSQSQVEPYATEHPAQQQDVRQHVMQYRPHRRQECGCQQDARAECDEPTDQNAPVTEIGQGEYGRRNDRSQI